MAIGKDDDEIATWTSGGRAIEADGSRSAFAFHDIGLESGPLLILTTQTCS